VYEIQTCARLILVCPFISVWGPALHLRRLLFLSRRRTNHVYEKLKREGSSYSEGGLEYKIEMIEILVILFSFFKSKPRVLPKLAML
jgi:hypothetical protein